MSVAFILNPGYNTINNVHHTFWNQDEDNIKNESLNPVLAVATSLSAPSHIVTGGTNPAQLYMSDPITLSTDAPQFNAPILQTASAELQEVTELVQDAGITFLNDAHFTSGSGVDEVVRDIDGVGTLTCSTLKYTTLDPAIPEADVSQWATFGASTNVNLNGNNLTDSTRSYISMTQPINAVSSTSTTGNEFGNSINASNISGSIDLWTNRTYAGANRGQIIVKPSNSTGGTAFYANPRSITLNDGGFSGDIQLSTSGSGKYRLIYDNSNKAITVNQSGALCFNSTFGANTPIDGSFGTAGQIIQSNGSSAPPSWVNAPTPSIPDDWSEYPATSIVDLNGYALSDSTRGSVYVDQSITAISKTDDGRSSFGNSVNNSNTTTSLTVVTNSGKAGNRTGSITSVPSNKTGASAYYENPGSVSVTSDGGDMQLYTYGTGKIRLVYDNFAKAITVNQSGAMSFNSTFAAGAPVDGDFGTVGQIIQSNGSAAPPSWVAAPAPGDPSTWASYAAVTNVDMNGYSISNSNRLSCENTDTTIPIINLGTRFNNDGEYNKINFDDGADVSIGTIGSTTPAPSATTWDAAGSSIISKASRIVNSSDTFCLTSPGSASALVRNTSGAVSFSSTFDATTPTYNFGTSGQIVQSNGSAAAPSWVSPAISGRYVLYVATDGLDTNAGDITHPKLTIQSAINAATALYPQQVVILVQPGVYSGALSITRPNITLLGLSPSSQQNLLTQIAGNISIACTASQDLYYSQVCIANLLVSGSIIDTSTVVHTLNIEACRIAANGQVFAQTSSADNRTRLVKCTLLQASLTADVNPMMLFSSGAILLNQLDVTAKNNCNLVKFNGTATLPTCALCTFTSDSASTVAEPIVLLAPTNGANKPFTFGYNAFVYSSYAPKLSHPESAGICVSSGTGRPYITVAYNSFALAGTDATNYAIYDTGYNTATAGYYFYFSNNGGVNPAGINAIIPSLTDFAPQAHHIYGFSGGGSQNKFTLAAVA